MIYAGDDTIVALATARGVAALATVRISGVDAVEIANTCFPDNDVASMKSHSLAVGLFATSEDVAVDQVVVSVFLAPHTVTGQDIVEISCHGGDYASSQIVQSLVYAGARPAEPGEFTRRGFLNGRMNLAQAEAVADLIHASSRRAQEVSLIQLRGSYSLQIEALRKEMLDLCAFVELELDFSEEDVAFADPDRLERLFSQSTDLITELIESYRYGALIHDGIRVVIGGRPNAGKSTLLNALVGYDRAIVSDVPGTTRDEIEADVEFDGLRIRFRDTAGLRDTEDAIEAEGVRRAQESIRQADVLLYVYDARFGLDKDERRFLNQISRDRSELPVFIIANKDDLLVDLDHASDSLELPVFPTASAVEGLSPTRQPTELHTASEIRKMSAIAAQSSEEIVHELLSALVDAVRGDRSFDESASIVTSHRHRDHLLKALRAIERASMARKKSSSGDILSLELRVAMNELGSITGATTNDDVLGHIFSKFCIGK